MPDLSSLSRRSMLRLASFAPLAFLAPGCATQELEAVVADECKYPGECVDKPVDPAKLKTVIDSLWASFVEGAGGENRIGKGVFAKAFDMSGGYVICNLNAFDSDGGQTLKCCKACGEHAWDMKPWYRRKINPDDFEKAWCQTQYEFRHKLARARAIFGDGYDPTGGLGC